MLNTILNKIQTKNCSTINIRILLFYRQVFCLVLLPAFNVTQAQLYKM